MGMRKILTAPPVGKGIVKSFFQASLFPEGQETGVVLLPVKRGPAGPVDKAHSSESYYLSGGYDMNSRRNIDLACSFIRDYVSRAGARGVVIGVSGGLDSAVTAYLACRALQPKNVLGLVLPYKTTDPQSLEDAELVIKNLGLEHKIVDITPQIEAYYQKCEEKADYLRIGNKAARERMAILYDYAQKMKYLVLGTSNKTEWVLGYFTLWGDMAAALEPLGDLYKSQILELAWELGVPERIINKSPSADLWPGQTDEEEIGVPYAEIDKILYLYIEKEKNPTDIIAAGFNEDTVQRILAMVRGTEFKRRLPSFLQLQYCQEPLI